MKINNKGFLSLAVLLFISVFLSAISGDKIIDRNIDVLQAKITNTKKQSEAINFEEIVKQELLSKNLDPITLNEQINNRVINHLKTSKENWYIKDILTQEQRPINYLELKEITKVIVIRPLPGVYIKRYIITNGINKNKYLCFEINTYSSKNKFSFPKNYTIEVIVYL